jgi:hypothetical protein
MHSAVGQVFESATVAAEAVEAGRDEGDTAAVRRPCGKGRIRPVVQRNDRALFTRIELAQCQSMVARDQRLRRALRSDCRDRSRACPRCGNRGLVRIGRVNHRCAVRRGRRPRRTGVASLTPRAQHNSDEPEPRACSYRPSVRRSQCGDMLPASQVRGPALAGVWRPFTSI